MGTGGGSRVRPQSLADRGGRPVRRSHRCRPLSRPQPWVQPRCRPLSRPQPRAQSRSRSRPQPQSQPHRTRAIPRLESTCADGRCFAATTTGRHGASWQRIGTPRCSVSAHSSQAGTHKHTAAASSCTARPSVPNGNSCAPARGHHRSALPAQRTRLPTAGRKELC